MDRRECGRTPLTRLLPPILNFQVGVGWQPPRYPNIHLFMGYLYEFWWQVGTNSNLEGTPQGRFGFFDNQGLVLQTGLDF